LWINLFDKMIIFDLACFKFACSRFSVHFYIEENMKCKQWYLSKETGNKLCIFGSLKFFTSDSNKHDFYWDYSNCTIKHKTWSKMKTHNHNHNHKHNSIPTDNTSVFSVSFVQQNCPCSISPKVISETRLWYTV
jgi:hypothetical protein